MNLFRREKEWKIKAPSQINLIDKCSLKINLPHNTIEIMKMRPGRYKKMWVKIIQNETGDRGRKIWK